MKVQFQLRNGHDCIFTEELPKHLQVECSVCLCVLDNPHMLGCACSATFCQHCIWPVLKKEMPCPLCNTKFSELLPDRRLQRMLNSLQVYCSFKDAGCTWKGELCTINKHLNDDVELDTYKTSGCPFLPVNCDYCNDVFQRQYRVDHERNCCLKRPFRCDK